MTTKLFSQLTLRSLTLKNRIIVSPMCMYSAKDGVPNEWHMVHLGSRAVGGAAVVIVEATGVVPEGRITHACLALHNIAQAEAFKPITAFIKSQGSIPAIQLAHSGRKGEGGWPVSAPSAIAFSERYQTPKELTVLEINQLVQSFKQSAKLALVAGFQIIEAHGAHGYLLHEFLSPISNKRADEFGGSLQNRMRFPLMVAQALRDEWPQDLPVFFRISATDWVDGGWSLDESVIFCQELKKIGIDFIDVSTGGNVTNVKIPLTPGYQVPFAEQIKKQVDIPTGAVGLITGARQAEDILIAGKADAILLARELLREPYWPIKAANDLGEKISVPLQYERAYK